MRILQKRKILASFITVLAVFSAVQTFPSRVHGATTGIVCIAQVTDTMCPASPPIFNGPLTTPNTLLRVPVMINNTDSFVGFDITLNSSNLSYLKPYGADLTGSIMPTGSVTLVKCVGGVLIAGSICSTTDNPSTVHLAVTGPFGFLTTPGATGLLFTAIFSVAGTTLPGGVSILYQNGCSSSSSSTLCVSIANGTISPVPESTNTGGFDNSATATLPYATLSTPTKNLGQVLAGAFHAQPTVTYTATSQNGFNTTSTTTLNLAAAFNGTGSRPAAFLSTSLLDISNTPRQTFTEDSEVLSSVLPGVYVSTVTATYQSQDLATFAISSLSAVLYLSVNVTDYVIRISPSTVSIIPPSSQAITVTISPKYGFNTLVKLGASIQNITPTIGISATLSQGTISGGSGTSTLTLTAVASASAGIFTASVFSNSTFDGFTRVHVASLTLTVGPPGFEITASPSTVVTAPGKPGFSTITATSISGFASFIALSETVTPSAGLSCNLSPRGIALNVSTSGMSALSCIGALGTYNVTIAGSGGGQSQSIFLTYVVLGSTQGTKIAVDPQSTIDLARASKTITVTVNLTSSPSINGFAIVLRYDNHVMNASSLDYSTNIFAQSPYPQTIARYCLNGHSPQPNLCGSEDGLGVTSFAMFLLGGSTLNNTSGSLFKLTFNVNNNASVFSQIQIKNAVLSGGVFDPITGKPIAIPVTSVDGYYTSLTCNGTPCTPPNVDFSWSPLAPVQNQDVTFNASASSPTPGETITDYFWSWDDPLSFPGYSDNNASSVASHAFVGVGMHEIALRVAESNGIKWYKTISLLVTVSGFTISVPSGFHLNAGEQLTVTDAVTAQSYDVNGSLTLSAISPQGLTVSFAPTILQLTPSSTQYSTLTFSPSLTMTPGTYTLTIIGKIGTVSHNATIFVVVLAPSFHLSVQQDTVAMDAGSTTSIQVSLFTTNLYATINLSTMVDGFSPLPNPAFNISIVPASIAISPGRTFLSTVIITANLGTPPGGYRLFVEASGGSTSGGRELLIIVNPDFTIQTSPQTIQVFAGTTGSLDVGLQPIPCCPTQQLTLNVTLSVQALCQPSVFLRDTFIIVSGNSHTSVVILTTPSTLPGECEVSVTGRARWLTHTASSIVIILPPPILTTAPQNGPVGAKVKVTGSGFGFLPLPGFPVQTHLFLVTFDDQFLGEESTSNGTFTFTFSVPDAQPGHHLVKALDLLTRANSSVPFEIIAAPSPLEVTIDTGSIYFPGDTAIIYVLVSQNGVLIPASGVEMHLTLIKPDGSNATLIASSVSRGLFRALYTIPTTGSLGTYALLSSANGPNSVQGNTLRSFEVKPTWLSSNGRNLASASVAIEVVGMIGLAWKKGYFRRKEDEEIIA